jgi:hypothetical protein
MKKSVPDSALSSADFSRQVSEIAPGVRSPVVCPGGYDGAGCRGPRTLSGPFPCQARPTTRVAPGSMPGARLSTWSVQHLLVLEGR